MNDRNLLKGLFLMAIALAFGLGALRYPIGRLERAGPGFFPLMVSSFLFLLGAGIAVRSRFMERVPMYFSLRNIVIIMASLAGFVLLTEFVNMIAGIVFMVLCASLAGSSFSLARSLKVAAGLIAVALVFQRLLGLQLPLY